MPTVSKPKPKPSAKSPANRAASSTSSESPTTAQAELDARDAGPEGEQDQALKDQAKEQAKQQAAELKAGRKRAKGAVDLSKASIVEQRTGREGEKPLDGRVDNMTRRNDAEPLQGHFVHIDYAGEGGEQAKESVAATLGEAALGERQLGVGVADYGVFLEPGQLDDDGYPATAVVMLRDEFAANVVVPYSTLRPAQAGRR